VLDGGVRINAVTGLPFWWALIDTVGGTFDVVIDPELLSSPPRPGNVIAGWFWLSGRLLTAKPEKKGASGWIQRLAGR
jgi:hypothetical protein